MPDPTVSRRSFMRLTGAAVLAPAIAQAAPGRNEDVWRSLDFADQQGRSFQLASTGPSTLMTMWAHWCPACLVEMGSLATMAAAVGPGLQVLLLSHPEYWERDVAVAQQRRLPFRLVVPSAANAPSVVAAALLENGAYAVPRSLMFRGRDGSLAWNHLGSMNWAATETIAQVRGWVG